MFRYLVVALLLKLLSVNQLAKTTYRKIGNIAKLESKHDFRVRLQRANLLLDLCRRNEILETGDKVLELGTGWYHWYSLFLRLNYDVTITMVDIWDNRRFNHMKALISQIQPYNPLINRILNVQDFDELYKLLNLEYVVDKDGSISRFPSSHFNLVFSFHTLEHVHKDKTQIEISEINRVLKPGGFSIHQIGLDDHLSHYDNKESFKKYLEFPERTWKRIFENDVQYFNRLQASDWLDLFKDNGFKLMQKKISSSSLTGVKVNSSFQRYSKNDVASNMLTVVHMKTTKEQVACKT